MENKLIHIKANFTSEEDAKEVARHLVKSKLAYSVKVSEITTNYVASDTPIDVNGLALCELDAMSIIGKWGEARDLIIAEGSLYGNNLKDMAIHYIEVASSEGSFLNNVFESLRS